MTYIIRKLTSHKESSEVQEANSVAQRQLSRTYVHLIFHATIFWKIGFTCFILQHIVTLSDITSKQPSTAKGAMFSSVLLIRLKKIIINLQNTPFHWLTMMRNIAYHYHLSLTRM